MRTITTVYLALHQSVVPNSNFFLSTLPRPNFPVELKFLASKAANPMDIYFLFDLSGSMADEKEQLSNISQQLAEARHIHLFSGADPDPGSGTFLTPGSGKCFLRIPDLTIISESLGQFLV